MLLCEVPGAVLSLILNGEFSWAAIELWKCGNRALNLRLAHYGVTHLDLSDLSPRSTSRWPVCLREFKLESLSIQRGILPLTTPDVLHRELKLLSRSLKSLEIGAADLSKAFSPGPNRQPKDASESPSDAQSRSRKRSKYVEPTDGNDSHTIPWNLDLTWPRLERLTIRPHPTDHSGSLLDPSFLALLPRSLLRFECLPSSGHTTLEDLSMLPPALTWLSLPSSTIGAQGLMTLPKSLTYVGKSLDGAALAKLIKAPELLPHLKTFESQSDQADPYCLKRLKRNDTGFSDTITQLTVDYRSKALFTKLPLSLTRLWCSAAFALPHLASLPPTLTDMRVYSVAWDKELDLWPSPLRALSVENLGSFDFNCFALLPRGLTSLQFNYVDRPSVLSRNPDTSSSLLAIGQVCLARDVQRWNSAKSRLQRLPSAEAYLSRVEAGELFGLPLGLTSLKYPDSCNKVPSKSLLPPLMQHFLLTFALDGNKSAINFLPPNTTHANMFVLPPADYRPIRSFLYLDTALYKLNLESLDITFDQPAFSVLGLQYVPWRLKRLTLNTMLHYDHLVFPSGLEYLDLGSSSFYGIKKDWVTDLPTGLTTFKATNAVIYGESFPLLPPKLETIVASFSAVTFEQVFLLPHPLSHLTATSVDDDKKGFMGKRTWPALTNLCRPFWRIREYSVEVLRQEVNLTFSTKYFQVSRENAVDRRASLRFADVTQ